MDVSVIIPCRNELKHIEDLIKSIDNQIFSGTYEILIVDGCSTDGTLEVIRKLPNVRLFINERKIASAAMNIGVANAKGKYIARMDAHTIYDKYYLSECLNAIKFTDAFNVGGPASTLYKSKFQKLNAIAFSLPFSVGGSHFHDAEYDGFTDTVPYGFWEKEELISIGCFDEKFIRNQDDELNLRATIAGKKIYLSSRIKSYYYVRDNPVMLFKQYFQYGYWKYKVLVKHGKTSSFRHFVPSMTLVIALFLLLLILLGVSYSLHTLIFLGVSYFLIGYWYAFKKVGELNLGEFIIMPLVFLLYHVSYGSGFIYAVIIYFAKLNIRLDKLSR